MQNQSALTLANITWLVAALAFVIAPHMARLPIWVGAVCIAAGAARWLIARNGWRTPKWWWMAAIAIGVFVGAYWEYKRIFGREVGVTLLIVMLCLKTLEIKMKRDVLVVIFIGFFLAMTNFLYSQSIFMGGYMFICAWIFVATLIGFNRIGTEASIRERLVPAAWLLLQAIPLMLVLFFLFPRLAGPLWTMPQEDRARSGLSDSMSPGDISKLSLSDAVAFRVDFEGAIPENADLYWRGPVLGQHEGRSWRAYNVTDVPQLNYTSEGAAIAYRVTLQPHNKPWLFALDMPGSLPADAYFLADYQMRSKTPIQALRAYEMTSFLRYRAGTGLGERELRPYLRYVNTINPRAIAYGQKLRETYPDNKDLIEALLKRYNTEFNYTLEPPSLGENPVDEFFFDTKKGFCEHYSSSFVFILRAAGIPARVVTGYQGGELNPITRQLVVRQSEAHAWSEVWLADLGWVRIDPTFAVSPLRINRGMGAALGPSGIFDTLAGADGLGLLNQLRYSWDAVNSRWNQWVIGFSADRQRGLLDQIGLDNLDWKQLALWMVGGLFLAGGAMSAILLLQTYRSRKTPVVAAYDKFCAKLAKAGVTRAPHEGPLDLLARIGRERPPLLAEATIVIEAYVAARYAVSKEPALAVREFIGRARSFRASR